MNTLNLAKQIDEYEFTVLDIETTGMSPHRGHEIVEIAAVKISKGLSLDFSAHFCSLIKPKRGIPYSAFQIHGIDNEMVENAPDIKDVLAEFAEFSKDSVLVIHNAKFDMSFISYFAVKNMIQLNHLYVMDTLILSRKIFPEIMRYSLDKLISHFSIDVPSFNSYRHRALYDAFAASVVFMKCIEKYRLFGYGDNIIDFINIK